MSALSPEVPKEIAPELAVRLAPLRFIAPRGSVVEREIEPPVIGTLVTSNVWPLRVTAPLALVIPTVPSTVPTVRAPPLTKLKPPAPAEPATVPTRLAALVSATAPVALASNAGAVIAAVWVMLPPASNRSTPVPLLVMAAFTLMSVVAFNVSVLAELQSMGLTT